MSFLTGRSDMGESSGNRTSIIEVEPNRGEFRRWKNQFLLLPERDFCPENRYLLEPTGLSVCANLKGCKQCEPHVTFVIPLCFALLNAVPGILYDCIQFHGGCVPKAIYKPLTSEIRGSTSLSTEKLREIT